MRRTQTGKLAFEPKTLTVRGAAKVLGIGVASAYRAIDDGTLPHLKIGRRIIVPRAALDKWLESCGGDMRPAA